MRKILIAAILLLPAGLWAQTQAAAAPPAQPAAAAAAPQVEDRPVQAPSPTADRLQLAVSSIEYPVTPSDVYRLTYRQPSGDVISRDLQVGGDCMIDLGLFGQIDARGLPFIQLKNRVESLVAASYSRSYPSISIVGIGVFRVSIEGGFSRLAYVTAWGLTKVSDVLEAAGMKGASLRKIELLRRDNPKTRYDALMARSGARTELDPLVKPGDVVLLYPSGRCVHLGGEVRRVGDYELLPGEGLRELIELFGGGATPSAELSRVRIVRLSPAGLVAEYQALPSAYESVRDLDDCLSVNLTSMAEPPPVVWFEGAVLSARPDSRNEQAQVRVTGRSAEATPAANSDMAARISCPIIDGQLLSETLISVRDRLSTMADLSSATLVRSNGQSVTVDLLRLLSSKAAESDIPLHDNDRILIPTLVATVSVTGAAITPGTFPFQPGRPAPYYIGLAGGSDPLRNANGAYSITSSLGAPRNDAEPVQPGDRIYLPENTAGITVSGAVNNPGMFPYQPGYPASYYINRAGGIDPDRNENGAYWVTDLGGKRRDMTLPLSAGDRIYVPTNAFGFNMIRYGPLITSFLALMTAIYPIIASIGR